MPDPTDRLILALGLGDTGLNTSSIHPGPPGPPRPPGDLELRPPRPPGDLELRPIRPPGDPRLPGPPGPTLPPIRLSPIRLPGLSPVRLGVSTHLHESSSWSIMHIHTANN